jgi:hypothetical protein
MGGRHTESYFIIIMPFQYTTELPNKGLPSMEKQLRVFI